MSFFLGDHEYMLVKNVPYPANMCIKFSLKSAARSHFGKSETIHVTLLGDLLDGSRQQEFRVATMANLEEDIAINVQNTTNLRLSYSYVSLVSKPMTLRAWPA